MYKVDSEIKKQGDRTKTLLAVQTKKRDKCKPSSHWPFLPLHIKEKTKNRTRLTKISPRKIIDPADTPTCRQCLGKTKQAFGRVGHATIQPRGRCDLVAIGHIILDKNTRGF